MDCLKQAYAWIENATIPFLIRKNRYLKVSWQVKGNKKAAYATYCFYDTTMGLKYSDFQRFEAPRDNEEDETHDE